MNHNFVFFYSEGPPKDDGAQLSYCKDKIIETNKAYYDNISFYTPSILKKIGYKESVKKHKVTSINKIYKPMCNIGLSAWKPLILLLELEKMNEGDILLYRDADYKKQPSILSDNTNIISILHKCLRSCKFDLFIPREIPKIKTGEYTKPIVIRDIANDSAFAKNFPLLICNFVLVRKSKISIELLKEWWHYCKIDKYINGETYNVTNKVFLNKWHTNEQSIINTIIANWIEQKKYGIPKKYPTIGFKWRNPNRIVKLKNYNYLKLLKK